MSIFFVEVRLPVRSVVIKDELPTSYLEVLKSVGLFMQYWGFKEVHGQVWTCIFLAKDPIDANHIIAQLKLSKAAISLAIKDLTEYKVILEVEKTKPSTRKYVSNTDLAEVILNVLRFREKQMLGRVVKATRAFSEIKKDEFSKLQISEERVDALEQMSGVAYTLLDQLLKQDDVDVANLFSILQLHKL